MAWVEPRISDDLAAPAQNSGLRHFRQQRRGQRFADAIDAEQQVVSAAQFGVLVDRLTNSPVDRLELAGEMLDRRGGQLGCGTIAETTAEAVLPLRAVTNDTGTHSLQLAQSSHRGRWRRPRCRVKQRGVVADQGSIDLVGLIATELGAGEVPDLRRVDHADDVTRVVQRQGYAEAMTPGRFHADMGLFAVDGLQPRQHQLPAIGAVGKDLGLLALASYAIGIQGLLGYIDSNYKVTHYLLP